ncbi:hypothetical protein D3C71_1187110 [compost metagenome]
MQAHAHGGKVGVGHGEVAKQQGAAVLLQQCTPHLHQALDVGAHAGFVAPDQRAGIGQIRLNVHGAVAAQGGEAAVHLGADAACARTGLGVRGPELLVGVGFGHVFGNRQGVPHDQIAIDQCRHLARGAHGAHHTLELRIGVKAVEAHAHFFKRNARLLEQHPGAHGPGGVVLVADVELEHGGT